jgi:sigma-B regulation protein RsbU (phosphoserine phosphatase)
MGSNTPYLESVHFTLVLQNRLDELTTLGNWVNQLAGLLGLSARGAFRLDMVLTEAVTNIIQYAYQDEAVHPITITLQYQANTATIQIVDDGWPFDPHQNPEVVLPANLEEAGVGGLGIHLIRHYADNCHYDRQENKNILTLTIFDPPIASPPENKAAPPTDALDKSDFSNHRLFKGIPPDLLAPVLADCSVKLLPKGEVLIVPGQENHSLYLLMSGRLQVYLDNADPQLGFHIDPGECVGEMSIIENRLTSAYVVAEEPSRLVVLPEDTFWREYVRLPGAVKNLLQMLTHRMRKDNQIMARSLEQQFRYEQLQQELAIARKIQADMLPGETPLFPHHPQVDVVAMIEPAKEVGGDFFDAFALDDQHIFIAIGDVSGKGMPAALFMVRVMTSLRMRLSKVRRFESLLAKINQILCEHNEECMFVTLFLGLLDVTSGRLTYLNGGHNPPFISKKGQPFKLLKMPKGMLVGVYEEAYFDVAELTLQPGDTLVLYTDGVTEAENTRQEFFSTQRAGRVLRSVAKEADITVLLKTLHHAVLQFSRGMPQSDDITMLALRYQGKQFSDFFAVDYNPHL